MSVHLSEIAFELGDLRSHRKSMRCVIENWPLD